MNSYHMLLKCKDLVLFICFSKAHSTYLINFHKIEHKTIPFCLCQPIVACVYAQLLSCVRLFATPQTVAHQAPRSMGFSRQEYWSGLPCPPPGDLPNPGIEPMSLMSPALAGGYFTTSTTWEVPSQLTTRKINQIQFYLIQYLTVKLSDNLQPNKELYNKVIIVS